MIKMTNFAQKSGKNQKVSNKKISPTKNFAAILVSISDGNIREFSRKLLTAFMVTNWGGIGKLLTA